MNRSDDALPSWDVPAAEQSPFPAVAAEMAAALAGDSSGHTLAHAWRVFDLGRTIAARESADPEVVGLSALVHDLHRVANGDDYVHPEATLEDVAAILQSAGVEADATIDAVQHCVAVHDDFAYQGDPDRIETVEAAVVQDAVGLTSFARRALTRSLRSLARTPTTWTRSERSASGGASRSAVIGGSRSGHPTTPNPAPSATSTRNCSGSTRN